MTASCSYFADVDISEENNSYWQKSVDAGHKIGIETVKDSMTLMTTSHHIITSTLTHWLFLGFIHR